jgi:hypothetical protein
MRRRSRVNTLFSLEVLPAKEGDCLLLHWSEDKTVALIDGGPAKTYEDVLRPRLMELHRNLGGGTLNLAFALVSHVDNDHIVGIRKLFAELRGISSSGMPRDQRPVRVERLWHNSFADVLGTQIFGALATVLAAASPAASDADVEAALTELGDIPRDDALEIAAVLAGHAQGRTLRDDHAFLHAAQEIQRLNAGLTRVGGANVAGTVPWIVRVEPFAAQRIDDLTVRIVGPAVAELKQLKIDFDKFLVEKGLAVPAALAAALKQDSSPTNLSSIVCLVEHEGKSMLLTGDALGSKVLEGLSEANLLPGGTLHVDVLKVPHHGSARNATPAFFETVSADTYVFSANGRHENPDRETLEWLVGSRAKSDPFKLVFTYPISEIDVTRKIERQTKGKAWDDAKDAIGPFLDTCRTTGHAFTFTEGATVIDVGETAMVW